MSMSSDNDDELSRQIDGFRDRLREAIGSDSVRGFSRKSGVSEGTIRSYLEGRNTPTLEKLILLANAGGKNVGWLATGIDDPDGRLKSTTIKTALLIEKLSDDNQREILQRIKTLDKSDKQEREIEELREIIENLLRKVG